MKFFDYEDDGADGLLLTFSRWNIAAFLGQDSGCSCCSDGVGADLDRLATDGLELLSISLCFIASVWLSVYDCNGYE